jgi:hypothetical protein
MNFTKEIYFDLIEKFGEDTEQKVLATLIAEEMFHVLQNSNNIGHMVRLSFKIVNNMGHGCLELYGQMRNYAYLREANPKIKND